MKHQQQATSLGIPGVISKRSIFHIPIPGSNSEFNTPITIVISIPEFHFQNPIPIPISECHSKLATPDQASEPEE